MKLSICIMIALAYFALAMQVTSINAAGIGNIEGKPISESISWSEFYENAVQFADATIENVKQVYENVASRTAPIQEAVSTTFHSFFNTVHGVIHRATHEE